MDHQVSIINTTLTYSHLSLLCPVQVADIISIPDGNNFWSVDQIFRRPANSVPLLHNHCLEELSDPTNEHS